MSAPIRRPIGSVAFASALLLATSGAGPWAAIADAADCLTAPDSAAPPNSHWYYRMDRATQRKCWHLRAINEPPQQGALKTAQAAPVPDEYSLANFKDFIAQRGNATLSDADIKTLYVQFLEWRHQHQ